MTTGTTEWYWCLRHNRVEDADHACRAEDRLGPYDTKEEAEHWRERVEARNAKWEAEDRAWSGEED
jgi:hypothetical protein